MNRLTEIERRYQHMIGAHQTTSDIKWLLGRVKRYQEALENIKAQSGPVCPEFEICTHATCNASAGAYLLALEALRDADAAD